MNIPPLSYLSGPFKSGREQILSIFSMRDRIAGELGDLILDRVPGRTNADEITIMKSVGFATLDVVTAAAIVEKARAAGIGTEIGF